MTQFSCKQCMCQKFDSAMVWWRDGYATARKSMVMTFCCHCAFAPSTLTYRINAPSRHHHRTIASSHHHQLSIHRVIITAPLRHRHRTIAPLTQTSMVRWWATWPYSDSFFPLWYIDVNKKNDIVFPYSNWPNAQTNLPNLSNLNVRHWLIW